MSNTVGSLPLPLACLPRLSPAAWRPHPLHTEEACWPETNCVVDLWIEILHALGVPPEPALATAARQDFEGDQFTFTKIPTSDLDELYGVNVIELAVYEPIETHLERQIARGRLCLMEADPWFLPDTGQASYRSRRGKTTIGVNRLDPVGRRMEYFHNGGYFALEGEDYAGVLRLDLQGEELFRPYVETAALELRPLPPAELRRRARRLLQIHWERRPPENPIRRFQAVFPEQAAALVGRGQHAYHEYAFHTLRLLGGNHQLLAACLDWLAQGPDPRSRHCRVIAETAKVMTLHLARAVARGRFDALAGALQPAVDAWDALFEARPPRRAAAADQPAAAAL